MLRYSNSQVNRMGR